MYFCWTCSGMFWLNLLILFIMEVYAFQVMALVSVELPTRVYDANVLSTRPTNDVSILMRSTSFAKSNVLVRCPHWLYRAACPWEERYSGARQSTGHGCPRGLEIAWRIKLYVCVVDSREALNIGYTQRRTFITIIRTFRTKRHTCCVTKHQISS